MSEKTLMKIGKGTYRRLFSLLIFLLVWELGGRIAKSEFLLPPVSRVIGKLIGLLGTLELWKAFFVSFQSFIAGLMLALLIGIPLGLLIGLWPFLDRLISMYIIILISTPIAPLVPLVVIVFGIGIAARIFLVFIFALPMVVLNTATGVKEINPSLLEMGRSFGASDLTIYRRICLPGALPAIMAGVRLGAARAVVAMVVGELIIVSVGIGELMMEAASRFRTARLFAITSLILGIGYLVVRSVQVIEGIVLYWKPKT